MLIDCPHCDHSHHVATASLGQGGRKMRCATCREIWHAMPLPRHEPEFEDVRLRRVEEAADEGLEISASATSERSAPPSYEELYGEASQNAKMPPPRTSWRIPRPPAALLVAVVVLAASSGLIAKRQSIVQHVPVTAGLYAAIGLPVNLRGLEFRHVASTLLGEGPQRVLAVEGFIANISRTAASVPELQLLLSGPDGREIYVWTTSAPKATLDLGEIVPFRARLAAPPEQANHITVRFAPKAVRIKEARK